MSMSTFRVEYKRLDVKNNILICGLDSYKVYDLIEKLFNKPDLVSIHYIEEERINEAEKDANLSVDERKVLSALKREIKAQGPFDLLMC